MGRGTMVSTGGLLVALTFGACGGTTGPGASTGGGEVAGGVCALLTVDEAGGALNSPPLETSSEAGNPGHCSYTRPGEDRPTLSVDVSVGNLEGRRDQLDELLAAGGYEEVAGVGDRAVSRYGEMMFLVGDRGIEVAADWGGNLNDHEAVILIGKIITARLTKGTVPPELKVTAPPVLNAKHACELLSAAEAETALGLSGLTATGNDFGAEFAPEFCTYTRANGEVVLSIYFEPRRGYDTWESLVAGMTTDPVAGIGDKAAFESYTGKLFVLNGDTILFANVVTTSGDNALAIDRQLMEVMLTHL